MKYVQSIEPDTVRGIKRQTCSYPSRGVHSLGGFRPSNNSVVGHSVIKDRKIGAEEGCESTKEGEITSSLMVRQNCLEGTILIKHGENLVGTMMGIYLIANEQRSQGRNSWPYSGITDVWWRGDRRRDWPLIFSGIKAIVRRGWTLYWENGQLLIALGIGTGEMTWSG